MFVHQSLVLLLALVMPHLAYDPDDSDDKPKPYGIILPSIVFGLVLVAMLVTLALRYLCKDSAQTGEPEEQINVVLCQEDAVKFEYNLIIRVGCPTVNFDMRHGFIDVEVLEEKDHIIGSPLRFDCSLLPDRICGEMHCLIGRVTPMPQITGIRISHGDKHGAIFLYEYILTNLPDESIIEVRRFNTFITNKSTIYRGTPIVTETDAEELGMYPVLPLMEWTNLELAIICSFMVMFVGSMVMLFEYNDMYSFNTNEDGSMFRSLMDVICITPLAVGLLGAIAIPYKFCMSRKALQDQYAINQEECQPWWWLCVVFLGFLLLVSFGLFSLFIIIGMRISFTKSLYWLCSCLIVWTCVFGTWAAFNKSLCVKRIFEEDAIDPSTEAIKMSEDKGNCGRRNKKRSKKDKSTTKKHKLIGNQTVYFNSSKPTRKRGRRQNSSKQQTISQKSKNSAGPKLVNPKQHQEKQVQKKQQLEVQLNSDKCDEQHKSALNSSIQKTKSIQPSNVIKSSKSMTIKNPTTLMVNKCHPSKTSNMTNSKLSSNVTGATTQTTTKSKKSFFEPSTNSKMKMTATTIKAISKSKKSFVEPSTSSKAKMTKTTIQAITKSKNSFVQSSTSSKVNKKSKSACQKRKNSKM